MSSGSDKSRTLELKINSDPANLAPARNEIESFCRACGFDDKSVGEVGLVLNEAMANVTRHAYKNRNDQPVTVTAEFVGDVLTIRMRDWGNGVDPSLRAPKKRDPNTPGGLGLLCIRELMDEVDYQPQTDGMLLIMKRRRLRE